MTTARSSWKISRHRRRTRKFPRWEMRRNLKIWSPVKCSKAGRLWRSAASTGGVTPPKTESRSPFICRRTATPCSRRKRIMEMQTRRATKLAVAQNCILLYRGFTIRKPLAILLTPGFSRVEERAKEQAVSTACQRRTNR